MVPSIFTHRQVFWQPGVMADFQETHQLTISNVTGTFVKGAQPTLIEGALRLSNDSNLEIGWGITVLLGWFMSEFCSSDPAGGMSISVLETPKISMRQTIVITPVALLPITVTVKALCLWIRVPATLAFLSLWIWQSSSVTAVPTVVPGLQRRATLNSSISW